MNTVSSGSQTFCRVPVMRTITQSREWNVWYSGIRNLAYHVKKLCVSPEPQYEYEVLPKSSDNRSIFKVMQFFDSTSYM